MWMPFLRGRTMKKRAVALVLSLIALAALLILARSPNNYQG